MAEIKKTKVQKFEEILALDVLNAEQREFIEKEIELIKKKNSHISKADKEKSALNENIKNRIVEIVNGTDEIFNTTQLANLLTSELNVTITSQRVAPLTNKLVDEGLIKVDVVKGRKFFKKALCLLEGKGVYSV